MRKITLFVLLLYLASCIGTTAKTTIHADDFDIMFRMLTDQCGPQERGVCMDSNEMAFCYHLVECSGTYAFSSLCGECLVNNVNYWCYMTNSLGNVSSICTNDPSICAYLDTEAIIDKSICPSGEYRDMDCNFNNVNDVLEIKANLHDLNSNGIIDTCETDCNGNGVFDYIDIKTGFSKDLNDNHIPDECDNDCNGNGIPDEIDLLQKTSKDANSNKIPDECEVTPSPSISRSPSPTPTISTTPSISVSPSQGYIQPSLVPSESTTPTPSIEPSQSMTPSATPSQPYPLGLCDGVECMNDGWCVDSSGRCECQDGWLGRHCEIPNCSFNGIYNTYTESCDCYAGWTGSTCNMCARTVDAYLDRVYICCPSFHSNGGYTLVLVPESKRQDYLNGVYTQTKCELQNASFSDGVNLDCACKTSESSSRSSSNTHTSFSFAMKNKLGNIIQNFGEMDFDSYNLAAIMTYHQIISEELSQNYPIQLANAIENSVVSFAESSGSNCNYGWVISISIIVPTLVIIGAIFVIYCAYSRPRTHKKQKKHHKKKKSSV